jgi:hypothetical protein
LEDIEGGRGAGVVADVGGLGRLEDSGEVDSRSIELLVIGGIFEK